MTRSLYQARGTQSKYPRDTNDRSFRNLELKVEQHTFCVGVVAFQLVFIFLCETCFLVWRLSRSCFDRKIIGSTEEIGMDMGVMEERLTAC